MDRKLSFSAARRYTQNSTKPNGFTLMELLIVIAIILILMLMAIPTIGVMKKHANETSAINSLRAITQAEIQYESTYPANGYACSLASLGGDPGSGAPTPTSSQLLQAISSTSPTAPRSPSTAPTASPDTLSRLFRRPWAKPATAASALTRTAALPNTTPLEARTALNCCNDHE
jgi:prepilin-type N-terminal cleavage/methylation domain-containing protein